MDEPNNGRMLHIVHLTINDQDMTEKYFGSWNRVDYKLENYTMDSNDGQYVYIPAESGGFLIQIPSLKKIELPYKSLSTITFLKNEFVDEYLHITHIDEVIHIHLKTFHINRTKSKTI